MMVLQPQETVLTGSWIMENDRVRSDVISERIKWLVANHMHKIAISPESGGWETLYQDPDDGRYWELSYPNSEWHGGGPAQLQQITVEEAKQKYKLS